jgi:hypothetical protein
VARPEIQFNERRFKDLLLYVAKSLANDPTFGETKANKVLFFSDFEAYRRLGEPITGADYQKNLYGPTARRYPVLRDELLRWGQLKVERRLVADHVQDVLIPLDIEPNMKQFSSEEVAIVDAVIEEMRQYTNIEVSDLSHERAAGWDLVELGDSIPYHSALISTKQPSEEMFRHAQQLARDRNWAEIRP